MILKVIFSVPTYFTNKDQEVYREQITIACAAGGPSFNSTSLLPSVGVAVVVACKKGIMLLFYL